MKSRLYPYYLPIPARIEWERDKCMEMIWNVDKR